MNNQDALAVFKINLDKLYKEYFNEEMSKMSFFKMEKMFNDFKITLMLIENFKNSFKNGISKLEPDDLNASIYTNDLNNSSFQEKSYLNKLYDYYKGKKPDQEKNKNQVSGGGIINSFPLGF